MFFANVRGGEELRRKLAASLGKFQKAMETILPEEGRELLAQAVARVPRQSGELAASGVVTSEVTRDRGVVVAVAFTDEKAAAVHEGVHHGRHIKGTRGFKWFERTTHEFEHGFVQSVAEKLSGAK